MCFINTKSFAIGEKNEIYWSIRMYDIALFCGVKHFLYCQPKGEFDPKYRCGDYEGKAKFVGNKGHLTRDYQQLDELLPNRIESVAEWMEKTGYTGEAQSVLKDWSDKGLSQRLSRA
ncbi:hypothetical protein POJ06DRAFT_304147 [Lipomyces tetrasporus]|uniref:Uncharacterized protein n=1 Tax=Lipomyces tetrasporus TaxID=54092 RepID=A0AAD7VP46_9ASCO|nr:uncharacterized protein POJ06DRAFT_304147 [Lipomyces tetrasporus]KAJ8096623.1 hypothetical protein POJ06DRAFT_304147 [Lipomyces tetrasporus]